MILRVNRVVCRWRQK